MRKAFAVWLGLLAVMDASAACAQTESQPGVAAPQAKAEQDLTGLIVVPGFIDGHVHVESSHMLPHHYAEVGVAQGTTTLLGDPP